VAVVAFLGPPERTLGPTVRVVYLHGAWVWTALIGFGAAGVVGLAGLAARRASWLRWAWAWGLSGTFFWITYLPLSLWAMNAAWNGLFLGEPRWRVGIDFAVAALLIHIGLALLGRPVWAAAAQVGFVGSLFWRISQTDQVMHPPSPIASSGSATIRLYFGLLLLLCAITSWQLARWLVARLPREDQGIPEGYETSGD